MDINGNTKMPQNKSLDMSENKPLLEVFVCTWCEEKILPDFIKWYRSRVPNCLITVYDNMSTDRTVEIALKNECKVIPFDTGGYMDEQTLMNIRNNCWKESEAKWCLVVDCDELVDVTGEFCELNNSGDIVQCKGWEMFGTKEDTIQTLLYGCLSVGYCKPVLFRPEAFVEINLQAGSHEAKPIWKSSPNWNHSVVNLYHTKWRSWTNGIERAKLLAERRSEHSRSRQWNFHYELPEETHREYYLNGMKNRVKVR